MSDPTNTPTYRKLAGCRAELAGLVTDDNVVRDLAALAATELEAALNYLKCMADPIVIDYMDGTTTLAEAVQRRAAQFGLPPLDGDAAVRLDELLHEDRSRDAILDVREEADMAVAFYGTEEAVAAALSVCGFPDPLSANRAHCRHAAGSDGCCWCGSQASSSTPTCRVFDGPTCPGIDIAPSPEVPY